ARLWLAGEGPRKSALEARAQALGLGDRVRFLGARDDVADLMEAADLFALSSEREGLPMTVIEAMRAGRALVSTRVGGTPEVSGEGETGTLVPIGGAGALARAMLDLLQDPVRRAAFGAAGRARWRERFTAERMVRATESLYRAELAGGLKARAERS